MTISTRILILLGFALLLTSGMAWSDVQPRVGFITGWGDQKLEQPLWQRLQELGWIPGKNITVDRRELGGEIDRVPAIARELLKEGATVFVVATAGVAARVREVTHTVPIVTVSAGDLVAAGLAASIAKPGGNVTGVQILQVELASKKLSLLKETLPRLSRVGLLIQMPATESNQRTLGIYRGVIREFEVAARKLRVQLNTEVIHDTDELKLAFATFHKQRTSAILVFGNLFTYNHRRLIADLALESKLPTMCDAAGWVQQGGLMAYYPPLSELFRLTAGIVDQVLRGTPVSDVPIQQPTVFALSVNLQTATALHLKVPPSVLAQASELVE